MEGSEQEIAHSPLLSDYVMKWLNTALDYGLTEWEFWDMTLAELERAIASKKRIQMQQAQEHAYFDYTLADLIGRSVGRIYSKQATLPELYTAYPTLFDEEEAKKAKQARIDELSALRFRKFAASHNKKFREVAKDN